ncbi:hypothetical protein [Vibrio rarus]|uniref:hypothetical protein n=1 Tax=Vibrio rarus TaxID=413403 RepID=UPI0021C26827|nr:hypothetical protein [Vibrio rarus]
MISTLRILKFTLFIIAVLFVVLLYINGGQIEVMHFYLLLGSVLLAALPIYFDSKRLYSNFLLMDNLNTVRFGSLDAEQYRELDWLAVGHRGLSSLYKMMEVFSRCSGLKYRLFVSKDFDVDTYCYQFDGAEVSLYISKRLYSSMTARDLALSLGLASSVHSIYAKMTDDFYLDTPGSLIAAYIAIVQSVYVLVDAYGGDASRYDLKNLDRFLEFDS